MLKLIGSIMVFGSCAALGLNARREMRRRVAAADAMLLALRLMESEIASRRTPMPEIIDLLAKNENQVVRRIFSARNTVLSKNWLYRQTGFYSLKIT